MRFRSLAPMLALVLPLSLGAQGADSALTVHGYLTQGVAGSTALAIWGIPAHDVTTDYRSAVIQFRYAMSRANSLTLQLGHRRYGVSALNVADGATVVDVAYFQHRSTTFGTVSVGRTQIPFGIYSGIRDFGALLPFYRAPSNFYSEGFRALDGVQLARTQSLGDGWTLDGQAFAGGIDVKSLIRGPTRPEFPYTSRMERAYGALVTLFTPIDGLELSGQGARFRDLNTGTTATPTWYSATGGSLNFTRTHGFIRSEYRRFSTLPSVEVMYYAQATLRPTSKLSLNTQAEVSQTRINATGRSFQSFSDRAASISYAVASNLVVKVEHHGARGYSFFNGYVPTTGGPAYTHYAIASLSASF